MQINTKIRSQGFAYTKIKIKQIPGHQVDYLNFLFHATLGGVVLGRTRLAAPYKQCQVSQARVVETQTMEPHTKLILNIYMYINKYM